MLHKPWHIDSQSAKITSASEGRGFDGGEKIRRIYPMSNPYKQAKAAYKALDADTDATPIIPAGGPKSIHHWQGDDLTGLDGAGTGVYISEVDLVR